MSFLTIVIALMVFGFITTLVLAFMPKSDPNAIQDKLRSMSQNPDTIDLTELELSKPFSERILKPIGENLGRIARMVTPVEVLNSTQKKITSAGMRTNPAAVVGVQVVLAAVFPTLLLMVGIVSKLGPLKGIGLAVFAGIAGYMIPNVWLSSKVNARKDEITRALERTCALSGVSLEEILAKAKSTRSEQGYKELISVLDDLVGKYLSLQKELELARKAKSLLKERESRIKELEEKITELELKIKEYYAAALEITEEDPSKLRLGRYLLEIDRNIFRASSLINATLDPSMSVSDVHEIIKYAYSLLSIFKRRILYEILNFLADQNWFASIKIINSFFAQEKYCGIVLRKGNTFVSDTSYSFANLQRNLPCIVPKPNTMRLEDV